MCPDYRGRIVTVAMIRAGVAGVGMSGGNCNVNVLFGPCYSHIHQIIERKF